VSSRAISVHIDLDGRPRRIGTLWAYLNKGRESASFEYDDAWLNFSQKFELVPALKLDTGTHYTERALFGAIGDSSPDRWGRSLMRRAERRQARKEGRAPRTLYEIDFLLGVDDDLRQGALRFSGTENGPFVAPPGRYRIPPLIELPRLLAATQRIIDDEDSDEDLRFLLAPGSSLGGARPKSAVRDSDGHLAIAKFPHREDDYPVELWEAAALALAKKAHIPVPEWRVETILGRPVLILRRFDRKDGFRIPFLSAMSMLDAGDGDHRSYMEIADILRAHGAKTSVDLHALWRRMVFSVLISNVDDHLRNHGFLYSGPDGWTLSPAYDLNPVPTDIRPRILSTAIDLDDRTASLDLALDVADFFDLNRDEAGTIAREVGGAVITWRHEAARLGLTGNQIERMSSAFEHADLEQALAGRTTVAVRNR
jgi:serine/threonine-protein kinase HipA